MIPAEMTNQEILDKVLVHLVTQPGQCRSDGTDKQKSACMYRRGDGNKCAVGVLIPDEFYRQEFEFQDFYVLHVNNNNFRSLFDKSQVGLMAALQDLHDNVHPSIVSGFTSNGKLERICLQFNLTPILSFINLGYGHD